MRLYTISILLVGALARDAHAQAAHCLPSHADSLIERLVGFWSMRGEAAGNPVRYEANAMRTVGMRFVELHMHGEPGAPEYEARVFIGADTAADKVVVHWMDTAGPSFSTTPVTGVAHGDTLAFEFAYPDGPARETFVWQQADRTWHMQIEKGDGRGGWQTLGNLVAARR
jgi:hypothetical protein